MLQLHYWIRCHRDECADTILRCYDTRNETLRHCAWVFELCWSYHCWVCFHRPLGGTSLRQEEHAGILEYLQPNRRLERGRDPGTRGRGRCAGRWNAPIQPMVSVRSAGFCRHNAHHRNNLFEREYRPRRQEWRY
jgi:hypothetical protein